MAMAAPIHIRLPEDIREALRAQSESTGQPEAELAREALSEYLSAKKCKRCGGTGRES